MQQFLGWVLIIFPGILYLGQIVSSINFAFAQKLGLQESSEHSDEILRRAEKYAAYWDLVTLGWLPLSGILMVIDNPAWPVVAFFGSAIYFDTSGREAAKNLCFKHEGIKIGAPKQQRLFFSTYIVMALLSVVVLAYSFKALCTGS